jgi:hypothetical protein
MQSVKDGLAIFSIFNLMTRMIFCYPMMMPKLTDAKDFMMTDARQLNIRQMRCLGNTNRGTRYQGKVVGHSPEFSRGLDCYGFSDFKRCTERHRALTSSYELNNPRRFNFGTPSQVWETMRRCWQLEPTSARIIKDIEDLPRVLGIDIHIKVQQFKKNVFGTVID